MVGFSTSSFEMEIKSNTKTKFHVIGWRWDGDGDCPSVFSDFDQYGTDLSDPYLLGASIEYTLPASSTPHPISIPITDKKSDKSAYTEIGDCSGPLFDWDDFSPFLGCNPYNPADASKITSDWINCNIDNHVMNPLGYGLGNLNSSGGDVFVIRTSAGNNAKILITSITATPVIEFDVTIYPQNSETQIHTTANVHISTLPTSLDLDNATPNVSGTPSNNDITIYSYDNNTTYQLGPGSNSSNENYPMRRAIFSGVTALGEAVQLRMLVPPYDHGGGYLHESVPSGGCGGPFKVASLDIYGRLTPVPADVTIALASIQYSGIGAGYSAEFWTTPDCSGTAISTTTIQADSSTSTDAIYISNPTSAGIKILSATAGSLAPALHGISFQ